MFLSSRSILRDYPFLTYILRHMLCQVRFYSEAFRAIVVSTFWDTGQDDLSIYMDGEAISEAKLPPGREAGGLPADETPPYVFAPMRLNFWTQLPMAPICECTNPTTCVPSVDKFGNPYQKCSPTPGLPRIPTACVLVTCQDISSCPDLPASAHTLGLNGETNEEMAILKTILATALGMPTIYSISCPDGFTRVNPGTVNRHPRQQLLITCSSTAEWLYDSSDHLFVCLPAANIKEAVNETIAPTTSTTTTTPPPQTTTAEAQTTVVQTTTPPPQTSAMPTTTPKPLDYTALFLADDGGRVLHMLVSVSDTSPSAPAEAGCPAGFRAPQGAQSAPACTAEIEVHVPGTLELESDEDRAAALALAQQQHLTRRLQGEISFLKDEAANRDHGDSKLELPR